MAQPGLNMLKAVCNVSSELQKMTIQNSEVEIPGLSGICGRFIGKSGWVDGG
jgi:hypothetical protein